MRRDDGGWIQDWYADPVLDRELGPLDEEWLEAVLAEHDGVQLVLEEDGEPAGLVGVVWGHDDLPHAITDIAVDPARRGEGLGRRVVQAVQRWKDVPDDRAREAYVDPDNLAAAAFFRAIGWAALGLQDQMLTFRDGPATPSTSVSPA
ncbi:MULTISPECIES: GNAT family N-acetyltransferase [Bacteria]|uniref:GNAT family N-acetyltransferase n=1 Tax=Bacteria TaxID=2 RepID=UPI003C7B2328